MLLPHGWLYGISALTSKEGGRHRKAACLALIVFLEDPDIYWELHKTCLHTLFSNPGGGLSLVRTLYLVYRTWKSVGKVWSCFSKMFRVTAKVFTVTLRPHMKDLASCFLFYLIPYCFPLTHSVLAPESSLLFLKSNYLVPFHAH